MKYKTILLTLVLLLAVTGCRSNLSTGQRIFVTPAAGTMKPGQTITLKVTVKDRSGKEIAATPVWTVENPLGELDHTAGQQVRFTATGVGTARIKVVAGGLSTSAQFTIVEPILTEFMLTPSSLRIGIGQTRQLTLIARDQFGDPMEVSLLWTGNPLLGTVDAGNRFTATAVGTGTLTVAAGARLAAMDITVEDPVEMNDLRLREAILAQLMKSDHALFPYELEQILELDGRYAGIGDLTGIQYCTNLAGLNLEGNMIEDLRPLARLTTLQALNLRDNRIREVSPLALLTGLRSLLLGKNPLRNIDPLELLSRMEELDLSNTPVKDLDQLYGMEDIECLDLSYCNELLDDDLDVLIHMQKLRILDLKCNSTFSTLEPLRGLRSLTDLDIRSNLIGNVTPLATCTALTVLSANDNHIDDLSPLANLQSLKRLNLSKNVIRDLTPLRNLLNLTALYLAENRIETISPLVQNTGLGMGDQVDVTENLLDLSDGSDALLDIQTLINRGVVMIGF